MPPRLPVYLDYHATTPVDPRVVEAMVPYFSEHFGNAASRTHAFGWKAEDAVEAARKQVAQLIGAAAREIVFTSGATESNNLALKGAAARLRNRGDHIVTVTTEHKAVLDTCKVLESRGFRVTYLPVEPDGLVSIDRLAEALTDRTILVSVMAANNEIGVLQPLAEIARLAHGVGAYVHTDAVQAVGKVPFNVADLEVDLVSITAHKMYGPKGVGALSVRRREPRIDVEPLFDGGGHERGVRSGTLNVPGIVGYGKACEIARVEMTAEAARLAGLRDRLLAALRAAIPDLTVNGSLDRRLPNNLNVSIPGIVGESLLVGLGDIAVSSGSACSSGSEAPPYVLKALGLEDDVARASIRFGLGRYTTEEEVDYAAGKVASVVAQLRGLSRAR